MKKGLAMLLIAVLSLATVFTVVGCGNDNPPETVSYTVTVAGGTGGGKFDENTDCTVTANTDGGKVFVSWTADGEVVSTSNPYTFKVTKNITLTAVTKNVYAVTVTGGKIDGKTTVNVDSGTQVTAIADEAPDGKSFIGWYDGETLLSSDAEYTFNVSKLLNIEAKFADEYTINVAGGKIDGKTSIKALQGASLKAIADSAEGKRFLGWYDGETHLSDSLEYTFSVTKSLNLTAKFVNTYTVTVVGGKIDGNTSATVDADTEVTVVFDAGEGKTFQRWEIDGVNVSTVAEYKFAVTANLTISAVYTVLLPTPDNTANQMFAKKGSGYSDMIVEIDRQKDSGDNRKTAFTDGVDYVLFYIYTSTNADKNDFVGTFKMVQTVKGANAEIQTMDGLKSIGIGSTPGDYYFDRVSNADFFAFIAAAVGDDYDKFETYYVAAQSVAVVDSEYTSSGISAIGTSVIQQAEACTVTVVGGTGGGIFEKNAPCTVTSTPDAGYYFVKWTSGGLDVSSDDPYMFNVSGSITLTAVFAEIPEAKFTVAVTGGTGGGEFEAGEECTLTPTVPEGKGFVRWTVGGVEVSTSFTYSFRVSEDVTVTAEFAVIEQIETPSNNNNQMFKYIGNGDGRNTTEFDRQKNGEDRKTAFVSGVDYVLYYVYTSQTADKADYVGTFKMVQTVKGANAAIQTMDGSLSISIGNTPGNYYVDNCAKATFYGFFAAALGEDYDKFATYYFAAQAVAVANSYYSSSEISEIGSSSIRQAMARTVTALGGTGGGKFESGETCTLTPTVPTGYYFVKWTVGGTEVSTSLTYSFTVTGDVTVTAVFEEIPAGKMTVAVVGGTGGGDFVVGEECTLTPTVPEGKGFVRWTVGGTEVSTSFNYTFRVMDNVIVTAEVGDLVQLETPSNNSNQMFNYIGYGDNRNTTEFDRQKNGEERKTAFVNGVDYVLYYIYTSSTADKADYVGTFKMVQTVKGADAVIQTMDGSLSISIGKEPGNYYIDNCGKATFFAFFAAAIGDSYDEAQRYYFAAQSIGLENSIYISSGISDIGTSGIKQS